MVRLPALAALALACSPTTTPVDPSNADGGPLDFSRRFLDLSEPCPAGDVPGNLLSNSSFEMGSAGSGMARNTGMPASSIPSWDGCCDLLGQGLTTIWELTDAGARCGRQALKVRSTRARTQGDALNQELTIAGAAGRPFLLSAFVRVDETGAGARLTIDLYNLREEALIATSPPLTAVTEGYSQLMVAGVLPAAAMGQDPRVQARLRSEGTLAAQADDFVLLVR